MKLGLVFLLLCFLAVTPALAEQEPSSDLFNDDDENTFLVADLEDDVDEQEDDDDDDNDSDEDEDEDTMADDEDDQDAAAELELVANPAAVSLLEDARSCKTRNNASACKRIKSAAKKCSGSKNRSRMSKGPTCNAIAVVRRLMTERGVYKVYRLKSRVKYLSKKFGQLFKAYKAASNGRRVVPKPVKRFIMKTFYHIRKPRVKRALRRGHIRGWKRQWKKWGWGRR